MSSKIPRSWFEDDPEWEMLRRKAENRPVPKDLKQRIAARRPEVKLQRELPRAQAKREDTDKEVVVNLKLAVPKFKLPDFRRLYRIHQKRLIMAAGVAACLLLIAGSFRVISARRAQTESDKPISATDKAKEDFTPLVPLETVAKVKGQQTEPKYQYDEERQVLAYEGEYNGAILTISQQAAPEKLKSNPGELQYIAQSIGADNPVETQKGQAYIATDAESNTQTAVFATDEVLVFIRSNKKLDSDEWKFYINQLNPVKA